jgi:hypothetical protein
VSRSAEVFAAGRRSSYVRGTARAASRNDGAERANARLGSARGRNSNTLAVRSAVREALDGM